MISFSRDDIKDKVLAISTICIVIIALISYLYPYLASHFVIYDGQKIPLFEHDYNCGFLSSRLTERSLEIAIAKIWIKNCKQKHEKIIEIGAVTPYYFDEVDDVCDPTDPHKKVNIKASMFTLDLRDKNVLCISTIEHIGLGEYGVPIEKGETAIAALDKILTESKTCFVTFPVGHNKDLDDYVLCPEFAKNFPKIKKNFYIRDAIGNDFSEEKDFGIVRQIPYGPYTANAVVLLEKKVT